MKVLIADFLQDDSIEAPVLQGVANVVVAKAHHESDLAEHLDDADAIILFHDVERMTDATFARAGRCKVVVRAGVGYNNVDLKAAGARGLRSATSRITGPRRSPTTRSSSSWPWPGTSRSRTIR